jgi:hypothetical protein
VKQRFACLVACAVVWAVPAAAQDKPQDTQSFQAVATAKALFEQGQKQLEDKNYDAACASFKASNDASARVVTLLNLGDCYEKAGKLASAWGAYFDAIGLGRRQGKPEYEEFATKKKDELEPRLSKLTIVVPPDVKVDGMKITRDAVAVEPAAWGVPMAVDTGTHAIDVTAPHKQTFHTTAVVDDDHKLVTVTVEKLAEAPTTWPHGNERVVERVVQVPSSWTGLRIAGVVTASAGGVAVAIGSVLGLVANDKYQTTLKNDCGGNPNGCTPAGVANGASAHDLAAVATGLFVGGLVAGLTGVTFYLVGAPSTNGPGAMVTVGGRF